MSFAARSVGRAVSSAVERLVYTERVGGSNPSPSLPGFGHARPTWRCELMRYARCVYTEMPRVRSLQRGPSMTRGVAPAQFVCIPRRHPRVGAINPPPAAAGVAQLVRAPACHAGGRGFEPRPRASPRAERGGVAKRLSARSTPFRLLPRIARP